MRFKTLLFVLGAMMPFGCGGGNPAGPSPSGGTPLSEVRVTLGFSYGRLSVTDESERNFMPRSTIVLFGKNPNHELLECKMKEVDTQKSYQCEGFSFPPHFECGKTGQAEPHEIRISDNARIQHDASGKSIIGSEQVGTELSINGKQLRVHKDGMKEWAIFFLDACGNVS
ncbi:MAG: hypothetical protein KW793_02055 [Candidatus Doudnabacteria bacterium]|nr:hypothetical protein [Candidatus Doudnabacteria bacterium]